MEGAGDAKTYLRAASTDQFERRMALSRMLDEHQKSIAKRASLTWKEDRAAEIERFARGIERNPCTKAAGLCCSAPGVRWLIQRWKELKWACHEGKGYLSEAMRNFATALLGVPVLFRDIPCEIDPPAGASADEVWEFRKKAIQARIDDLESRLGWLDEAEALDLENALQGRPPKNDRKANKLIREIEKCDGLLAWIDEQVEQIRLSEHVFESKPIVKDAGEVAGEKACTTWPTATESPQANTTTHVGTVPKVEPRPSPAPQGKNETEPTKPLPVTRSEPNLAPARTTTSRREPLRPARHGAAQGRQSIDFKPFGQRTLAESLAHKFS